MPVSLIVTVFNESGSLPALMESICGQTRPPDEIVISDGGSTDGTLSVLQQYAARLPLRIVEAPGANISEGRNTAIRAASHDLIAVTDAGVRLDPGWLEQIIAPLEAGTSRSVAGFFIPDPCTPFEVAMGATVLPSEEDIDPGRFMPSSRSVAFTRAAWEAAGGYPAWLDYCEDLILDFRMAALVGPFTFAPAAIVHFRPRESLGAFFRQYRLYARGDGKAGLFFRRHLIRFVTYFAALPSLLAAALLHSPWWLLALIPAGAYLFGAPYRRLPGLWGGLSASEKVAAALWVPVIRIAGDLAKMLGYPEGVVWRLRHRPPNWRVPPRDTDAPEVGGWLAALLARDAMLSDRLDVSTQRGLPRLLAALVTHSGDGPVLLSLLGALAVAGGPRLRALALAWIGLDLLVALMVQVLKRAIQRPRPAGEWGRFTRRIDPHSFPSGHAARGGVMAAVGLLLAPLPYGPVLAIWAILIGLSRVMLGVHYLSDVAAGLALGGGLAAAVIASLLS